MAIYILLRMKLNLHSKWIPNKSSRNGG